MVSAEQIKAARALLRMEQEELAKRAGVSVTTIRRLESASDAYPVAEETANEVQSALEEAGVEFIYDGVRRVHRDADPELLRDLMNIAEESARLQAGLPQWTEADLYDEHGLPK
ncbi:MAG TPA: helix-turn-helix transcriptional regulator [Hyphomicrobiales bacterium]|nr:helix-turn-helix transcriptional regulator [Hyphomicrobiales bacterium]